MGATVTNSKVETTTGDSFVIEDGDVLSFDYSVAGNHHDSVLGLAPTVTFGWYSPTAMGNTMRWGLGLVYQYLDAIKHSNLSTQSSVWSTPLVPGTNELQAPGGQFNELDIHVKHELALMLQTGVMINKFFVHAGIGPVLFWTRYIASFSVMSSSFTGAGGSIYNSGSTKDFGCDESVWGGRAAIGFSYNLGMNWVLDTTFSYALSEEKTLNQTRDYTGFSVVTPAGVPVVTFDGKATAKYKGSFSVAGINVTLNKLF
jgi:hypothetical protein